MISHSELELDTLLAEEHPANEARSEADVSSGGRTCVPLTPRAATFNTR